MSNALFIILFLTLMTFDEFDLLEDGSFCGWDNTDSLPFQQDLIKIGKPNSEIINKPKSNRNKFQSPKQQASLSNSSESSKPEKKKKRKRNKSKTKKAKVRRLAPLKQERKPKESQNENRIHRSYLIRRSSKVEKSQKINPKPAKMKMAPSVRQISPRNALNPISKRDDRRYRHHNDNGQQRQSKAIKSFISRRQRRKFRHLGAVPFSSFDTLSRRNCAMRELVPIVTKLRGSDHSRRRVKNASPIYVESKPKMKRAESEQISEEIQGILAQRRRYLDSLNAIFASLDRYVAKLDERKLHKSAKQIEAILSRFDKKLIFYLSDLRKSTWNLVFFLKSVQNKAACEVCENVIGAVLKNSEFVSGQYVHAMAYLHLPNTACNPFLLPKAVLDPMNRCAHSKKLSNAVKRLKAVHSGHDLNRIYRLNEMDRHRYLSAHQWLLQMHQSHIVNSKTHAFERNLKLPRL